MEGRNNKSKRLQGTVSKTVCYLLIYFLAAPAVAQAAHINVFTSADVIPEGSTTTILIQTASSLTNPVTIHLESNNPGRLSANTIKLSRTSTKAAIALVVQDNQDIQTNELSFQVTLRALKGNLVHLSKTTLNFTIPPNDLTASLAEPITLSSIGSANTAVLHVTEIRANKSFIISSPHPNIIPSSIITADQKSFVASIGLAGAIKGPLPLTINYLDALKPTARMSAEISTGHSHTCALKTDNTAVCWGYNGHGRATPPKNEAFLTVSAGPIHTCGVKIDNTVTCWGRNDYGQAAPLPGNFLAVSAGRFQTCGIKTDNTIVCWGSNDYGQSAPPPGNFLDVSAGRFHICGVKTDNTAVCWGSSGDDKDDGRATPPKNETFVAVSAGWDHTCGIKTDNTAVCWGGNGQNQGKGRATPPQGGIFLTVDAGRYHTCGVKLDSTVVCWGGNFSGQSSSLPNDLRVRISPDTPWLFEKADTVKDAVKSRFDESASVTSHTNENVIPEGSSATIVMTEVTPNLNHPITVSMQLIGPNRADAVLSSTSVQLTNGVPSQSAVLYVPDNQQRQTHEKTITVSFSANSTSVHITPNTLSFTVPPNDLTASLVRPAVLNSIGSIGTAKFRIMGLEARKSFIISSSHPIITVPAGIITTDQEFISATVILTETIDNKKILPLTINYLDALKPTIGTSVEISAGEDHTCGVKTDNTAACWGNNDNGQSAPPSTATFLAVSAGYSHTCGVKTDNTIVCWGSNSHGQSAPPTTATFLAVSAGRFHNCAIKTDNTVSCWGSNSIGQSTSPPTGTFLAVSAGGRHTCAIKTDNTAVCWGSNDYGQSASPSDMTFLAVSAGHFHNCGIKTGGIVDCWGNNEDSLGYRTNQATVPPRLSAETFLAVSGGEEHTCGAKTDSTVECWGYKSSDGRTTPPRGLQARINLDTPWLFEKSQSVEHAVVLDPDFELVSAEVHTDRTVIPEGSTATILIQAVSAITDPVTIRLESDSPGRLSANSIELSSTRTKAAIKLMVPDNQDAQTNELSIYVTLQSNSVYFDKPILNFTIPPNDLTASLVQYAALSSIGSTNTAIFRIKEGLESDKSFVVSSAHPSVVVPSGIITADQDSFAVAVGLRDEIGGSLLPLTINYLDALKPAARMSAEIAVGSLHACAIKNDNTAVCWGSDYYGEASPPPTETFLAVSAGGTRLGQGHSCGIKTDNTAVCWGYNGYYGRATAPQNETFLAVGAGNFHTCGVKTDNTAVCWGSDYYGQASSPPSTETFLAVSVGSLHTCGLKTDNTAVCWGDDQYGQFIPPSSTETFLAVSAGRFHTCAIKTDGTAECWGYSRYRPPISLKDSTFLALSSGSSQTCAVKTNGAVECWGGSSSNQADLPEGKFLAVSAGIENTFGFYTCAVKTDGTVECWGNKIPRLLDPPQGLQARISLDTPWLFEKSQSVERAVWDPYFGLVFATVRTDRTVIPEGSTAIILIRADSDITDPVTIRLESDSPGRLSANSIELSPAKTKAAINLMVPDNQDTQTNELSFYVTLKSKKVYFDKTTLNFTVPPNDLTVSLVQYATLSSIGSTDTAVFRIEEGLQSDKSFIVSSTHPSMVVPSGIITADQDSFAVTVGLKGKIDSPLLPLTVNYLDALKPAARMSAEISVGAVHACTIKTDNTAVCWGINNYGQTASPPAETFLAISAGGTRYGGGHSCGIKTDNTAACWGHNGAGRSTPPPTETFLAVSAGSSHSCGIKTDNTAVCWGHNGSGRSTLPSLTETFLAVSAGNAHTCAIKTDNTAVCWGNNNDGQSTLPSSTETFLAVSAGRSHTCGIKTDNTAACWGHNGSDRSTPPPNVSFLAVSAGDSHTCGIKTNGDVECWGISSSDQADPPEGKFIAVSAGATSSFGFYNCAIHARGTSECWGNNSYRLLTSSQGLQARISLDTPWLFEKSQSVEQAVWDPYFGLVFATVLTDRTVIPEGSTAIILIRADSDLTDPVTIHLKSDGPGRLSANSIELSRTSTEAAIKLMVPDNQDAQTNELSFLVTLQGDSVRFDKTTLNFTVPPNDLTVSLVQHAALGSIGSTDTAVFRIEEGLESDKSFMVSSTHPSIVVSSGIITADQDSFAVTVGLKGKIDSPLLPLTVNYLDALRPSARMSAEITVGAIHACTIKTDNTAACWGRNNHGQAAPPLAETFLALSAGGTRYEEGHSCGIKTDNTIACWGYNGNGRSTPPSTETFLTVSAGNFHTCAIKTDNTAACWGSDYYGQAAPPKDETFLAVGAGRYHSCGVKTDGTAVCWGSSRQGQLISSSSTETFLTVSAGNFHTCAIKTDGTIACWGDSRYRMPISLKDSTFLALSAGSPQTCAVKTNGDIECWGDSSYSQADPPEGKFIAVSAGVISSFGFFTCAIHARGTTECWGNENSRILTPPNNLQARISPDTPWLFEKSQSVEQAVSGLYFGLVFATVLTDQTVIPEGSTATILIRADSDLTDPVTIHLKSDSPDRLFANSIELSPAKTEAAIKLMVLDNQDAQTNELSFQATLQGDSVRFDKTTLNFTVPPNDLTVSLVQHATLGSIGSTDTAVFRIEEGLQSDKSFMVSSTHPSIVVSSGIMTADQDSFAVTVGLKGKIDSPLLPLTVNYLDALIPAARMSAEIAVGAVHACTIKTDNTVRCWGRNNHGQASPPPAETFLAVSAGGTYYGESHTCAIKTDNTIACWGYNGNGRSTPPSTETFLTVSAGNFHSCGIKTDNTIRCWGSDYYGQAAPPKDETFLAVNAGYRHSCGIKTDNTAVCWGDNQHGQFIPSSSDETFLAVSAGRFHTCAIKTDGTAECWGYSRYRPPISLKDSTFLALSAGGFQTCGIKTDGAIACWKEGSSNQADPPEGKFLAVSAGEINPFGFYNCAIHARGTAECWGNKNSRILIPPNNLQARISPDTPWLFEKSQSVEQAVWDPYFGVVFATVLTDQTVIPEGSTATILIRADSDVTDPVTIHLESDSPGRLSANSIELSPAKTEAAIKLMVPDNQDAQTNELSFQVTLKGKKVRFDKTTLNFTIPPNDLTVSLVQHATLSSIGSTDTAVFRIEEGLESDKSFMVSSTHPSIVVSSGIITADQDSFAVTVGLKGEIDGLLPLTVNYLDALKPSARMSAEITVGAIHACTIKTDNTAQCWGILAVPSELEHETFLSISAGGTFFGGGHICGVKTDNTVVCWGSNFEGRAASPPSTETFITVSAGHFHSCGVKTDSTAVCWGSNSDGQSAPPSSTETFLAVSAGYSHSCGVKTDSTAVCWGSNSDGQSTPPSSTETFLAVSAGEDHSCGVKTDSTIVCWGNNRYRLPVSLEDNTFFALSARNSQTCGVKTDGAIACWGSISSHQANPPEGKFLAVSAGVINTLDFYTCAVKTDGTVACWGNKHPRLLDPPQGLQARISLDTPWLFEKSQTVKHAVADINSLLVHVKVHTDRTVIPEGSTATILIQADSDLTDPVTIRLESDSPGRLSAHSIELSRTKTEAAIKLMVPDNHDVQTNELSFHVTLRGDLIHLDKKILNFTIPPNDLTVSLVKSAILSSMEYADTAKLQLKGLESYKGLMIYSTHPKVVVSPDTVIARHDPFAVIVGLTGGIDGSLPLTVNHLDILRPTDRFSAEVSAGRSHTCTIKTNNAAACWGSNSDDQSTPPPTETLLALSAGRSHTCAIKIDNTVACWGSGDYGQSAPPPTVRFLALSAGDFHSCGIKIDGAIACWGSNHYGQAAPPENEPFLALSAGSSHSCGIKIDNTIECWGSNSDNQSTPPSTETWLTLSAGSSHTCGIKNDNTVACWGSNSDGRAAPPEGKFLALSAGGRHSCGIKKTDDTVVCWGSKEDGRTAPLSSTGTFLALSAGGSHSCAVSNRNAAVECWGSNSHGQAAPPEGLRPRFILDTLWLLEKTDIVEGAIKPEFDKSALVTSRISGNVIPEGSSAVVIITEATPNLNHPITVNVRLTGPNHQDAMLSSASVQLTNSLPSRSLVLHVPDNLKPQVHQENVTVSFSASSAMVRIEPSALSFTIPPNDLTASLVRPATLGPARSTHTAVFLITGLEARKNLIVSSAHPSMVIPSVIITVDQDSFAVTVGLRGEIDGSLPLTVNYLDALRPAARMSVEIAAGSLHSCAIKTDNTVVCWGSNSFSQAAPPENETFLAISAGKEYSCGVKTDNTIACWGDNSFGQAAPLENEIFLALSAGIEHGCGVKIDNTVACWGNKEDGRTVPPSSTETFLTVSAGEEHSCGIKTDNTVECWGNNNDGQSTPPENETFLALSAGNFHSCGIKTDNTVACWGSNSFSQAVPPESETFLAISAGKEHSCGIKTDNTVACWGSNGHGRAAPPSAVGFLALSAGEEHSCGIRETDNVVACWGNKGHGRAAPPESLRARINPSTLWLHEKAQAVEDAVVWDPYLGLTPVKVHTDRTVVPEGSTASILIQAASVVGSVRIHIESSGHSALSAHHIELDGASTEARLTLSVPDNHHEQTGNKTLQVTLKGDLIGFNNTSFNQTTLSFTIPPNDLTAFLIRSAAPSPRGIPGTAEFHVMGLDAHKSFIISSTHSKIIIPSGIITTDQDSLAVAVGLTGSIGNQETLPFTVNYLDALKPTASTNAEISAGYRHTCAIKTDNTVACWGDDGDDRTTAPDDGAFLSVSAGEEHTCAIKTDNTIACWEDDSDNQTTLPDDGPFLSVSVGEEYTCGVKTDSTIACWEDGDNQTTVPDGGPFLAVSAGEEHGCGVKIDNTVTCWGDDGDGKTHAPEGKFLAVSVGEEHSCGIRMNGTVVCWGDNDNDQTDAPESETFLAISAGSYHSCGIRMNGAVVCWGDGDENDDNDQTDAPEGETFLAVSAGEEHSCGIKTDKTVACWGDDRHGKTAPTGISEARTNPNTPWLFEKTQHFSASPLQHSPPVAYGNEPIDVVPSAAHISFAENAGSALLDQNLILNDPDGPVIEGNVPGGMRPADDVYAATVLLSTAGRNHDSLRLRAGQSGIASHALRFPGGSKDMGQAWLRTLYVTAVPGNIPPASATVTVTVQSMADDIPFASRSSHYTVSVWKKSRLGQGLVADDLEHSLGIQESSDSIQTIHEAVARYCGEADASGYYKDSDRDGVPNNVEVMIGTDCTLASPTDFVGRGRPKLTISAAPGMTPAFSSAPHSLSALYAACHDPDSMDHSCRSAAAYMTGHSDVCTPSRIEGRHASECRPAFSTHNNHYTAPPGLINTVWLGVGTDGDWAHNTEHRTAVIALSSQQYYLAPIVSIRLSNPRSYTEGWFYPLGSSTVTAQVALPETHPHAEAFTLNIEAQGMHETADPPLDDQAVQTGRIVSFPIAEHLPAIAGETLEAHLSGEVLERIALKDHWMLEEEDWLYSKHSLRHTTVKASVREDEDLNPVIRAALVCGGIHTPFYPSSMKCGLQFTGSPTHWGHYITAFASTGRYVLNNLSYTETEIPPAMSVTPPEIKEAEAGLFHVLNVTASIRSRDHAKPSVRRTFSFPIVHKVQSLPDRDQDGVLDHGTIGDSGEYLIDAPDVQSIVPDSFLSVIGSRITLGPYAYASGFSYRHGADLSRTKTDSPILRTALSVLPNRIPAIGVYDFYLKSDTAFDNQPARVSIPLRRPLPAKAAYRTYKDQQWHSHPVVYSAPKPCPPIPMPGPITDNSGWSPGLTQGHSCILVELTDDCSADLGAPGQGDSHPGCGIIRDMATITGGE